MPQDDESIQNEQFCLLTSGDPDPHVPWSRGQDSARELERIGAKVKLLRHLNRPHAIQPEIHAAKALISAQLLEIP
jgi:phospholipase/carboxylesterase